MGIYYEDLTENVRVFMVEELDWSLESGNLYISPRLTEEGVREWPALLREALLKHDDSWLANELRKRNLIRKMEQRKTRSGFTLARVPRTAPDTLAEGEFNRFYIRGLCRLVIESGGAEIEVYRGKEVATPRPSSQAMIGQRLPAQQLLESLRESQGVDSALGLPPGPNSGLTIRKVRP